MSLRLFIGNYNYSSWSLRPWLILRKMEVPFTTEMVDLDVPGFKQRLLEISPAGTVPVLDVNGERIPDSLAIAEFCAKMVPNLWPKDEADKSEARRVTQMMHEGFEALRREAPMNLKRRTDGPMPKSCLKDAAFIVDMWDDLLSRHDGPYLFNDWSIADAFYTPVATRFESYGLPRTRRSDTYISELMSDEHFQEWEALAFAEDHVLPETDAVNA
ncbi:glutathione S-transferase [Algimonas porphyrae]|uniref:Glutathione S-transferase n=1 Tax=Algimonas porphyrae TaxID=1128113 RepID=A0ABQ5UXU7_9PROT|nr:glutathione S-transferase [Algimonas porphyrae]GLQ20130.1 glutathione S-transferase [Algimonas porphyrae]